MQIRMWHVVFFVLGSLAIILAGIVGEAIESNIPIIVTGLVLFFILTTLGRIIGINLSC